MKGFRGEEDLGRKIEKRIEAYRAGHNLDYGPAGAAYTVFVNKIKMDAGEHFFFTQREDL